MRKKMNRRKNMIRMSSRCQSKSSVIVIMR